MRGLEGFLKRLHARHAIHLVIGNLNLNGGYYIAKSLYQALVVRKYRLSRLLHGIDCAYTEFGDKLFGQVLDACVQTRDGGVMLFYDAVYHQIHLIHSCLSPPAIRICLRHTCA